MDHFAKGQRVEGVLFDAGVVVAVGSARELHDYDKNNACEELDQATACVAVETDNGVAVYVEEEVWGTR